MIRVDLDRVHEHAIEEATAVIRAGGLVLHPTDTIYGLACDPFNESALDRLFGTKGRDLEKGFLVLIPSLGWLDGVSRERPEWFPSFAAEFWPGPVTVLLKASHELPPLLLGTGGKIGVRLPAPRFLRAWLDNLGTPLVSTSANLSGQPPPGFFSELQEVFSGKVDLILEGGKVNRGEASSVVDLTGTLPEIVRMGSEEARIRTFLNRQ